MPYITKCARAKATIDSESTPGELNYMITGLCHKYILEKGLSYLCLNEVIGVLECAKLELYRTVVAEYENKKRKENGPISSLDDNSMENIR